MLKSRGGGRSASLGRRTSKGVAPPRSAGSVDRESAPSRSFPFRLPDRMARALNVMKRGAGGERGGEGGGGGGGGGGGVKSGRHTNSKIDRG